MPHQPQVNSVQYWRKAFENSGGFTVHCAWKKPRGQTYVDSLLAELCLLPDTHIVCLTNRLNHVYYQDTLSFQCYVSPVSGSNPCSRFLYQQLAIGRATQSNNADILCCPGNLAPMFTTLPTVVVIHDMNFCDISESVPLIRRCLYHLVIPRATRSASQIITVSQFSKQRITEVLNVASDKIAVVHEGPLADINKVVASNWQTVKRKYAIRGECFFSVSSSLPHKNIERLVHGFVEMKKQSSGNQQLILVGHGLDSRIKAYLKREGFDDAVIATGFISEAEKRAFLENSIGNLY